MGRLRTRTHGSTMLEMAIALPIFLLLVLGVIAVAQVYNHQMAVNTAAREGARLAAVGWSDDVVREEIVKITPNLHHTPERFQVIIDRNTQRIAVQVTYTEHTGIPVMNWFFNNKKLVGRHEHKFETEFIDR